MKFRKPPRVNYTIKMSSLKLRLGLIFCAIFASEANITGDYECISENVVKRVLKNRCRYIRK